MEYTVNHAGPEQQAGCIIVGVFEQQKLSPAAEALDRSSEGQLAAILRSGDLSGRTEQTLLLHHVPNTACERVLLVGCGREQDLDAQAYRKITLAAMRALGATQARDAVSYLPELSVQGRDAAWNVRKAVELAEQSFYKFNRFKKADAEKSQAALSRLSFGLPSTSADAEQAIAQGLALAHGVKLTRDLGNLPSNVCTPSYLADQAQTMAQQWPALKVNVLDQKDMEALGMGSLLAVARGSREPAKLIVLQYRGAGEAQPYVLVGKAITFDSGGISIKPAQAMDEMKYDMCGGASVLGTLAAVAELQLPINLIGIVPSAENMPDGAAVKPGDIVTSLSGQTIEILNTDAEGRLILCDALSYAERFKPAAIIDIATLTGACVIALGNHASGLFSNDQALAHELLAAGEASGDRAWQLPLWDDYQKQLDSNFADIANIGGREAGSITAACFLSRFTRNMRWAHLDIAGTAWTGGKDKGATGRPVPLLFEYLLAHSQ